MADRLTPEQVAARERHTERMIRAYLNNKPLHPVLMQSTPKSSLADQILTLFQQTSLQDAPMTMQVTKRRKASSNRFTFDPHFKLTPTMDQPTLVALPPRYASLLKPPLRTFRTPENANDFHHWKIDAVRQVNQLVATTTPHCVIGEDEPGFHCTIEGMERRASAEECGELCQLFLNAGWRKVVVANATLKPSILFVCVQLYPEKNAV